MKSYYKLIICLFLWGILPSPTVANNKVTPNEVYRQVDQIFKEVTIIRQHFQIPTQTTPERIRINFKPRHVWQKTYEVLLKINILRTAKRLPIIEPNSLEPVPDVEPILAFEQTERILTELKILKFRFNIQKRSRPSKKFTGKTPSDVFNYLNHVSFNMDLINGTGFTPSYTFAQAMRIHDDVVNILNILEIKDTTDPPSKRKGVIPRDVFESCEQILDEIGRIQQKAGIERTDFSNMKIEPVTPTEVFGAMEVILAELQPLKASLGAKHIITPPANHYNGKKPSDVIQILFWTLRKLQLIQKLR